MSHYNAYPSYVKTNNGQLSPVPSGWASLRLRYAGTYKNSNVDKKSYPGQPAVQLCNYTDVYYNEFVHPGMDFMSATASPAEIERFELKAGDIIITKDSEDPKDIGIPTLVSEDMPGVVCGYHLTVIKADSLPKARFLHRLLQSEVTRAHFFVESPGVTRFGLNQEAIGGTPVALPSEKEMQSIADALDRETARIDALIEKKTRFIELLKEKRQALITQAVTKGLDPTVPMKDSGVEWIDGGKRLRHLVKISPSPKEIEGIGPNDDVTFVPMEAIDDGIGGLDTSSSKPLKEVRSGSYNYFADGDLLLAKVTPCFENGKKAVATGLTNGIGFATSEVHVIRPDTSKISRKYLHYLLCSEDFRAGGMRSMTGAGGLKRISDLSILDYRPAITDVDTQEIVAAKIDRESARIDTLMRLSQRSIDLLKERRSALITAAVTGQIDLREGAA